MNRSTWKKGESRIAGYFGTTRTPLSGMNSRHTASDSLHERLFIEVKHRSKMPFAKLWHEVMDGAKLEGKTPLIVLIEKGSKNPMVMCSIHDIKKIASELIEDNLKDDLPTELTPQQPASSGQ